MKTPSYLEEPQVSAIDRLLDDVRDGGILVPRFQRRFVWRDEDRLALFESIRDGIPIGSFLVWRTSKHRLSTFSEIGGISVPKGPELNELVTRTYLLDGHQRLSTLFSALSETGKSEVSDIRDVDLSGLVAGDVEYDLDEEEFILAGRKRKLDHHYLPLSKLMDSVELIKFQRALPGGERGEELINRSDALAKRFRNYKIPIIPIVTNDLEAATRAFERINTTGVKMDDFHMVAALTFSKNFSLAERMEEAYEELSKISWQDLDERYILAVIRARAGLEISRPKAEATSRFIKENPDALNDAVGAVVSSAKWLRERCLIPSPQFVPYSYQIVFLAYAFLLNRDSSEVFEKVEMQLERWLWYTTYTGFFRGARESEFALACEQIRKIAIGRTNPFDTFYSNSEKITPDIGRFDFRSARAKAMARMLAAIQIQAFPDRRGEILETMADAGAKCLVRLIDTNSYNGEEGKGFENRFLIPFGDELKMRGSLTVAYLVADGQTARAHGLDFEDLTFLVSSDMQEFFRRRRENLISKEREFVESNGMRYSRP